MTSEKDAAGDLREVACVVAHAGIDAVATVTGEELSCVVGGAAGVSGVVIECSLWTFLSFCAESSHSGEWVACGLGN